MRGASLHGSPTLRPAFGTQQTARAQEDVDAKLGADRLIDKASRQQA